MSVSCVGNKEQILWKLWISITKETKTKCNKKMKKKTLNKLTTNLGSVRPIIAMLYTTTTEQTQKKNRTYTKQQHWHSQTNKKREKPEQRAWKHSNFNIV